LEDLQNEVDNNEVFGTMPHKPAYNLNDFILDCEKNPEKIHMIDSTLKDAQNIGKRIPILQRRYS
jgi:hypothetical protein